jgi:hypothetical protein
MKSKAVLFGINYTGMDCELNGCVNDVNNIAVFLKQHGFNDINIYTDTNPSTKNDVCAFGICSILLKLVDESYENDLDLVWIHYSGHGTSVECFDGDETDGRDECLVPLDYELSGFIKDDTLCSILHKFNPKTKVILLIDSCNSGTICDLKYHYKDQCCREIENKRINSKAKILCLSACRDEQTSADTYNVFGPNMASGAMTSVFLDIVQKESNSINNVFVLIEHIAKELKQKGFDQIPQINSSYELNQDLSLLSS